MGCIYLSVTLSQISYVSKRGPMDSFHKLFVKSQFISKTIAQIFILMTQSGHSFAYVTRAELSWQLPNIYNDMAII